MALDPFNQLSRLAGPAQAANGTSTMFTGQAVHIYTIKHIILLNLAGTATTVKVGIGGVGNANLIIPPIQLVATNGVMEWEGMVILSGTDTLQINCSQGSAITYTINGLDQS